MGDGEGSDADDDDDDEDGDDDAPGRSLGIGGGSRVDGGGGGAEMASRGRLVGAHACRVVAGGEPAPRKTTGGAKPRSMAHVECLRAEVVFMFPPSELFDFSRCAVCKLANGVCARRC